MKSLILSLLFCTSLYAQNPCYDKAWSAYTLGRYEDALASIRQCIGKDSTDFRLFFLKGKILEGLYRYDQAIVAHRQALQLNGNSLEAKSALAALYLQSGQPETSAKLYEQLVQAEPEVNRWKMSSATALQTAGKNKEALEYLYQAVETDSMNWLVYKDMGDCYYRLDNVRNAAAYYRKSLDRYPQNKLLYVQLMKINIIMEEYGDAINNGTEAIDLDPGNVEAWKHLGIAWFRGGMRDSSYRCFKRTLELGDTTAVTCRYFGMLCYYNADYIPAEQYLSRAALGEPNNLNTKYLLSITYGYTGKAEKGLEVIDDINNIVAWYDTMRIQAEVQRGYLYRILNRYEEAAQTFIAATKALPSNARNFYEVAVSYDMMHKKKQALDWYIRFLNKIDPEWETTGRTDADRKKNSFQNIAMDRVAQLKTDLFFEEGKRNEQRR